MHEIYKKIVLDYYNPIKNYCKYKLNNNDSLADDVTQEVFFTLYKKFDDLRLDCNIKLWLYRVADNKIKEYIRKNPSFVSIDECANMVTEDDYPTITDSALDCLTPDETNLLKDYYDDKHKTAEKHNINMNTLYIRIHRIKKKLFKNMSENHQIKK